LEIVAHFEIPYYQILNEKSQIIVDLPAFAKDTKHLLHLYRLMILNRVFDTKAIALQRTGKIGTYPSTKGQEAVFVGIGDALAKTDIFVPYYRDVATLLQRGVTLTEILLYWGGDERGNCFKCGGEDFPYSVPIGTQSLHAAGAATAIKIKNEKRAVLTTCGDGGTSEGDFYEAMNLAGVWQLPIVFVVSNNQWAISVPRSAQSGAKTLAQKAIAAGFQGEQVDGNDVIAVRERVAVALKNARENNTPMLLEIISYRHHDHTTADDASRYEPKDSREIEWKKEPISRLRTYLENNHNWSQEDEENCRADCSKEVDKMVEAYLNMTPAPPESMFDTLYASLPSAYIPQREKVKSVGESTHG
jgi:2-oxoisovalerate dehydrogenase E1 component alpha subunit